MYVCALIVSIHASCAPHTPPRGTIQRENGVQSLCVVHPRLLCWYGSETALNCSKMCILLVCFLGTMAGTMDWMKSSGLGGASSLWSLPFIFSNTIPELVQGSVNLPFFAGGTFSWAFSQLRARSVHTTEKLDWRWYVSRIGDTVHLRRKHAWMNPSSCKKAHSYSGIEHTFFIHIHG